MIEKITRIGDRAVGLGVIIHKINIPTEDLKKIEEHLNEISKILTRLEDLE